MTAPCIGLRPPPEAPAGCVTVPGSKSETNRALVAAGLAAGPSCIDNPSPGDDTRLLVEGLRGLGVGVAGGEGGAIRVDGRGGTLERHAATIDVGLAGTSYRFLAPLCALASGPEVTLTGNARMQERPVGDLVDALRRLGAAIAYTATEGCPPLVFRADGRLHGGRVTVSAEVSSQFLSALLLVAPALREGLTIELAGPLGSRSYVALTLEVMERFGVTVEQTGDAYHVPAAARYTPHDIRIDGDASAATYFWGIAAITGGCVTVDGLRSRSTQGDLQLAGILERMGCGVVRSPRSVEVTGPEKLQAVTADLASFPDAAQTLAVVASVADGESRITGLGSLPHKETDRLRALETELRRIGIEAHASDDAITVVGGDPSGAGPRGPIETYGDHRMAMAFAMLGARAPIDILAPDVVAKSFPGFWETLRSLGVTAETAVP